MELKNKHRDGDIPEVKSLPTKVRGLTFCQLAYRIVGLSLSQKPEIVINGFKKAGIFDALTSDGQ